jgi:uncharacterized protein (DUF433 family)
MKTNQNKLIEKDPKTGKTIIKGTDITVSMVIDSLLEGADVPELCKRFKITREQIRSALDYIMKVRERVLVYAVNKSYENYPHRRDNH